MDIQLIEQPPLRARPLKRYSLQSYQSVGFGGGVRRAGAYSNTFTPFFASGQYSPPGHGIRSYYLPSNETAILHDLKEKRKIQEPLSEKEGKKRLVQPSPSNLLTRAEK